MVHGATTMVQQVLTKLMSAVLMVIGLYWLSGQSWNVQPTSEASHTQVSQLSLSPDYGRLLWRWQPQSKWTGEVVSVPTGDSVVVASRGKQLQLRLCGIDAPELAQPTGKTAQSTLQKLLQRRQIEFVPIRKQSQQIIAEVLLPDGVAPAQLVNQHLVAAGLAGVYAPYVNECPHRQALLQSQIAAQENRKGIWSRLPVLQPWDYRRQQVVAQVDQVPAAHSLSQFGPSYLRDGMQESMLALASWYGPVLHGRKTANGEKFDQNALTAAHPSLPFNTRLKVTNLQNGKAVIVRINDHQPAQNGATIDLSKGAAQQIGSVETGIVPVAMEIIEGR